MLDRLQTELADLDQLSTEAQEELATCIAALRESSAAEASPLKNHTPLRHRL